MVTNREVDRMTQKMALSEMLAHSTIRIEVRTATSIGTGTGFFFNFAAQNGQHVPVIITNKHVVAGAVTGKLIMTKKNAEGGPDRNNLTTYELENFEASWIPHPEDSVDLCAMPIGPLLQAASEDGEQPFYIPLDMNLVPTEQDLEGLSAMEDVVMIGYPNGIWDSKHNMPVFRRGVTATHPNLDWNGEAEFLIDAACFPGSSGSPVFLFNVGGYTDKNGNTMLGSNRLKLLGVLYAGPQHTVTGEIRIVKVPTVDKPVAVSSIPNNLGIIIKARKLAEFESLFIALRSVSGG